MLFQIIFEDKSTFNGGESLFDTKWLNISLDKKIRTIIYFMPFGSALLLSGFKRIYHFVEGAEDLNGSEKGKLKVEYTYLIIEKDNKYIQYKINQVNANVEVNIFDKNSEYINKLNQSFWRG